MKSGSLFTTISIDVILYRDDAPHIIVKKNSVGLVVKVISDTYSRVLIDGHVGYFWKSEMCEL